MELDSIIHCPTCNTSFDIKENLEVYKKHLFKEIDVLIKNLKGGKK